MSFICRFVWRFPAPLNTVDLLFFVGDGTKYKRLCSSWVTVNGGRSLPQSVMLSEPFARGSVNAWFGRNQTEAVGVPWRQPEYRVRRLGAGGLVKPGSSYG